MRYKGTIFYLTTENPEFGTQLVLPVDLWVFN